MSDKTHEGFVPEEPPKGARTERGKYIALVSDFAESGLPSARITLDVKVDALYAGVAKALSRVRQDDLAKYEGIRVVKSGDKVYLVREER